MACGQSTGVIPSFAMLYGLRPIDWGDSIICNAEWPAANNCAERIKNCSTEK